MALFSTNPDVRKNMWILDYLNSVYFKAGLFESEEAAWNWVETYDSERRSFYTPFFVPVNHAYLSHVKVETPAPRYVCQR
jgi:hypothetical protein